MNKKWLPNSFFFICICSGMWYVHICVYVRVCAWVYVCVIYSWCLCIHVCARSYVWAHMCMHTYVSLYVVVHACVFLTLYTSVLGQDLSLVDEPSCPAHSGNAMPLPLESWVCRRATMTVHLVQGVWTPALTLAQQAFYRSHLPTLPVLLYPHSTSYFPSLPQTSWF